MFDLSKAPGSSPVAKLHFSTNDNLQIDPIHNLQADLQFRVRIGYSMANQSQEQTLTLDKVFEVVFSNASNWNLSPS